MSILSTLFSSKPAAPAPTENQHVQNNPTVPSGNNVPATPVSGEPQNGQSPTDQFKDLWSTPPTQQGNQAPNFQLTPEQLSGVTSKMNFASGISQDQFAKVAAGGQEAAQALADIVNQVGRQAFTASAQFSSNLTEAGYNTANQRIGAALPTLVTNHLAKDSLYQANPKLRDPAIQPMVEALQSQLQMKNPNATPQEINASVNAYFERVQQVIGAPAAAANAQAASTQADFGDFSSFLQQPQG